jgi:hypothetical protein
MRGSAAAHGIFPKEEETSMRHVSPIAAVLSLALMTASPVVAQTTVQLFGKTYSIVKESRAQTYKKEGGGTATVVMVPRDVGTQLANLHFVEGADPSKDRLFVGCNVQPDAAIQAHQFYLLTGADANGAFTKDSATITEYFGGAQNMHRGGRPTGFIWLNDDNTGAGVDRNIAISTFWNADYFRLFDLDKMTGVAGDDEENGQPSDAVFSLLLGDGDSPGTGFTCYARMPQHDGHTVVVFANNGGTAVGVWDTKKDTFFPVSTNFADVITDFPLEYRPTSAIHYSGNEYWVLLQDVEPGPGIGGATATSSRLQRVRLTFPTDLAAAELGSIKVELLEAQELKGSPLHAVDAATEEGIVYGIAKGREVASGLFRLYFGDSEGNIYTATPQP